MNNLITVVGFIDAYDYAKRIVSNLNYRVDNTAVILRSVIRGKDI